MVMVLTADCRRESPAPPPSANEASPQQEPAGVQRVETPPVQAPHQAPPDASAPLDPANCTIGPCHGGLLQSPHVHAPVTGRRCDVCHVQEGTGHAFTLKSAGADLCTTCHEAVGGKPHVHAAVTKGGCLSCHDPHGSSSPFLLNGASVELTCLQCHTVRRQAVLHGPFALGECTACHEPHESDNPHLLVGGEGGDHCFVCHQDMKAQLASGTVHQPVGAGCDGCHVPHTSDVAGLLNAPVEQICFTCHANIESRVASAASPHGAVFTGHRCANCHDPHAAGRDFLLRDDLLTLCLDCHDEPVQAFDGRTIPDMRPVLAGRDFPHGPVRSGQCTACHDVHGGRGARLLRERFPTEFYDAFDLPAYALCFQCHNPGLVTEARTKDATGFRDGDRNLHYIHVHREEKGRTCRTCHEIHGSDLPRHMAAEVPFEGGGWALPIRFEERQTGGRCSPGCHQPYDYNRQPTPDPGGPAP